MRSVQKQISRIRNVCKYFHHSPKATDVLRKKQDLLGISKLSVIMDCATRWNSTYAMVERFEKIRPAIIAAILSPELTKKKSEFSFLFKMSEGEDQDIVDLLSILQPIERVTNIMSTSEHATVSLILPLKNTIIRHCEPLADDSSTISAMKQAVVDDLSQRYATPAMKVIIIFFLQNIIY